MKAIAGAKYGVDIAVRRADDLDRMMIEVVSDKPGCTILDLGCGAGGQSVRLAQAGARVTGVDVVDYSTEFEALNKENKFKDTELSFVKRDINDLAAILKEREFDFCSMQRVLHYLPYGEALDLLKYLKTIVKDKLFISVSGLESEIGRDYEDKFKSIDSRFCRLNSESVQKFYITEPVCFYTQAEFESLLTTASWSVEKCWVSAFGNIKAVCD